MIPQWFRRAMFAPSTNEDVIALVRFSHRDWDDDIRTSSFASQVLSYDPLRQGTISNGEEFVFGILSYQRPDDTETDPPQGQVVIQNIESSGFIPSVSGVEEPSLASALIGPDAADVVVELLHVAKSAPDVVLTRFPSFVIAGATGALEKIALDLQLEPSEAEPVPFEIFSPQTCPGMFP